LATEAKVPFQYFQFKLKSLIDIFFRVINVLKRQNLQLVRVSLC